MIHRTILLAAVALVLQVQAALAQIPGKPQYKEQPTVNPSQVIRQTNWDADPGATRPFLFFPLIRIPVYNYSCVHASLMTLLNWQNEQELARSWATKYAGAETLKSITAKLDREGIPYQVISQYPVGHWGEEDYRIDHDVVKQRLTDAMKNRRGAVITFKPDHACILVDIDSFSQNGQPIVGVIDPNQPEEVEWYESAEFWEMFFESDGWAVIPEFSPAPPLPWIFDGPVKVDESPAQYYTTVFTKSESGSTMTGWFDEHPILKKVKEMTMFNVISSKNPLFKRYAHIFPRMNLPAVMVQKPTGQTLYFGRPRTAGDLADQLGVKIEAKGGSLWDKRPRLPWKRPRLIPHILPDVISPWQPDEPKVPVQPAPKLPEQETTVVNPPQENEESDSAPETPMSLPLFAGLAIASSMMSNRLGSNTAEDEE